jgi:Spy/CpxP family protein refolding chaperone
MNVLRHIFPALVAGVLMTAALAATAQPGNTPSPRPAQRPNLAQNSAVSGYALGGPVGVLTEEQRASYEAALNRERPLMLDLQKKLRAARQDFLEASVDQKYDENLLRQKALIAARIEAEMALVRAKAMSEVKPPLTPEQIQKIKAGQPGPIRPMHQEIRPPTAVVNTNRDANGLPPKK